MTALEMKEMAEIVYESIASNDAPGYSLYEWSVLLTDAQEQVIKNSQILAKTLIENGIELVSGGTDNHLVLLKTDSVNMSGKEAGEILEKVDITCNKNMVPNDKRSPFVTSGIRLGTPAVTTRGFKEAETKLMAELIVKALKNPTDEKMQKEIKKSVHELCLKFPVYK